MDISEIVKWLEENDFQNGVQGEVNQAIYHLRRANEKAAQQNMHPTCGDSAPMSALSTPEADTPAEVESTPPTSG